MKKHKIPGLSVAVVDCNGILWAAGFGYTDKDKEIPVTLETIFSIQSMSKTFTATAVMCAVSEGLVELDTPITEYLPSFTVHSIFEENPEKSITLRHLLSHRAGFTHNAPVGNLYDMYSPSFEDHVLSISDTWLKFPVGQKYSYSNNGIDLAGYILQVQSGKPLEQYVSEKIFEPLGMSHSSMDMRVIRENKNRAIGHSPLLKIVPLESPLIAAGGVYTNAVDLAEFVRFHLNFGTMDQREIVPLQVLSQMYRSKDGYGLGLRKGEYNDIIYHAHGGSGFGFTSYMFWCPEYGIGAIELTNSAPHYIMGVLCYEILDKIITQKLIAKKSIPWLENIDKLPDYDLTEGENVIGRTFTPTPYKKEWSLYQGRYIFVHNGFEPTWYVKVALALGYEHDLATAKIRKKDGYLTINNERLEEVEPGLFFTASGEALDFRNDVPTWRNIKLKKR
ncbi:MAG: beta-lactamase family protein [Phycisphaerae bacterium]|nr:beta-lactamase family protein [Phycisphaerae bacterium]